MKVKNILFTYITPFHPERGGIGRVTDSLTREFINRGYNVFYLIYECGITIKYEYDYPAPLQYFPSKDLLSKENIDFYHDFLDRYSIDIVINQSGNFNDSFLYLQKGCRKVKVISVLHSTPLLVYPYLWYETYPLRNKTFIEKLKRLARIILFFKTKKRFLNSRKQHFTKLLPLSDYICCLSEHYFKEISFLCPGYEKKYIAIHNPNTYSSKNVIYNKQKENIVLFVGVLIQNKRPDILIKIWNKIYKKYPDWKVAILGDGEKKYVEWLKSLVKADNISFEGFKSPLEYYKKAKILCFTSLYEGWGMVLTEAMQCGTVPIAFNSFASVTDIIDDGRNGILVKPFSIKQYVKALRILMDNPDLLKQMSDCAIQDIKKYSVENVVDKWEELFKECTNL